MKTASKICFQGDVAFQRVAQLPVDAKLREGKGANIVAHSETGHHHVVRGADVFSVPSDPTICYLRLAGDEALIEHLRPHDTHETIALTGGQGAVYKGIRQREYTPEGWRQVQD